MTQKLRLLKEKKKKPYYVFSRLNMKIEENISWLYKEGN